MWVGALNCQCPSPPRCLQYLCGTLVNVRRLRHRLVAITDEADIVLLHSAELGGVRGGALCASCLTDTAA